MPFVYLRGMRLLFCLFVLGALGEPTVAQAQDAAPLWGLTAFAGLSQHLGSDRLSSAFGAGLGIRHRLGQQAGVSLEATFLPLGSRSISTPYQSLLDSTVRGTQSLYQSRKVVRLGLTLDLPLTAGRVRPSLLVGVDLARLYSKRSAVLVDSTGTVLRASRFDGWTTGLGAHAGAALGLPALGPLRPAFEARLYGIAFQEELAWSVLPVLTAGLTVIF